MRKRLISILPKNKFHFQLPNIRRKDFYQGLGLLFIYVFWIFLLGLGENFAFNGLSVGVARAISMIIKIIGIISWLVLAFIPIFFWYKKKRAGYAAGVSAGCLIILLFFLSGLAAVLRIFF